MLRHSVGSIVLIALSCWPAAPAALGQTAGSTSNGSTTAALIDPFAVEHDPSDVQVASRCQDGSDCAVDVPMTGRVSPLFRELDIFIRQYMVSECFGGGAMTLTLDGKTVYKRGFGRLRGAPSTSAKLREWCSWDIDSESEWVRPSTPFWTGSIAKWVTAVVARDLVWKRIVELGRDVGGCDPMAPENPRPGDPSWCLVDASEAKLLDRHLGLLPPDLLDLYHGETEDGDAVCPPGDPGSRSCTRAGACDTSPDKRWLDVTFGDLLAHSIGLGSRRNNNDAPGNFWPLVDQTRSLETQQDFADQHEILRDRLEASYPGAGFGAAMDRARASVAEALGPSVNEEDVFFFPLRDEGKLRNHDVLALQAARCLMTAPKGSTDRQPVKGTYLNRTAQFVDAVAQHLWRRAGGHGGLAGPSGYPARYRGSAMEAFLAQERIHSGVETDQPITGVQFPSGLPGHDHVMAEPAGATRPLPTRPWNRRAYCVWDGTECSLDAFGSRPETQYPFHFATDGQGRPELVEPWRVRHGLWMGTGGMAMEMPVLAQLGTRFVVARVHPHKGLHRIRCPLDADGRAVDGCGVTHGVHGGVVSGLAHAVLWDSGGGADRLTGGLPAEFDDNGRLPPQIEWASGETFPGSSGVADAVWAVAFNGQSRRASTTETHGIVRLALQRVAWDSVRSWMASHTRQLAGLAFNPNNTRYEWSKADEARVAGGSRVTYRAPGGRNGQDVVAVAIHKGTSRVYTYYADGYASVSSTSSDLGDVVARQPVAYPAGYSATRVVGMDIAEIFENRGSYRLFTWFDDGTRFYSDAGELFTIDTAGSTSAAPYTVAPGKTPEEIEAIGIRPLSARNLVVTSYRDGSESEGVSTNLDSAVAIDHAPHVGLSVVSPQGLDHQTFKWSAKGTVRQYWSATPAETAIDGAADSPGPDAVVPNAVVPNAVVPNAHVDVYLPADLDPRLVYGVASWDQATREIAVVAIVADPDSSTGAAALRGEGSTALLSKTEFALPAGQALDDLVGVASDGRGLDTYWMDGRRFVATWDGSRWLHDEQAVDSWSLGHGNALGDVVDIARSADGRAWALMQDGRIVEGRSPTFEDHFDREAHFGAAAVVGDFDADGRADLAVGVPGGTAPDGGAASGVVDVYRGVGVGLRPAHWMTLHQGDVDRDNAPGDQFGFALAVGDFNEDQIDDLVVGVPGNRTGGVPGSGFIVVYHGSTRGLVPQYSSGAGGVFGNVGRGDRVGAAMAVGDYDRDGVDDVAVGAPGDRPSGVANGSVMIWTGTRSGRMTRWKRLTKSRSDRNDGETFGASLATIRTRGSLGDGLAVGDPTAIGDPGSEARGVLGDGKVYLYGDLSASEAASDVLFGAPGGQEAFGKSLASGDLDANTLDDLVVGAPGHADGAGRVVVYRGTDPTRPKLVRSGVIECPHTPRRGVERFGASVVLGHFVAGPGDDLVVGAPTFSWGSLSEAGRAFVYAGGRRLPSYVRWIRQWRKWTNQSGDRFGATLFSGPLYGGTLDTLLVGVPGQDAWGGVEDTGALLTWNGLEDAVDSQWQALGQDAAWRP